MSAIVRIECYKENLRFSFNLSLKGGGRSPPTSLIFLYALTSFFFKQRLLMWRKGGIRPPFNPLCKRSGQRGHDVPSFESHQSRCKFSVQLNWYGAEVNFKALEKL